jgi:hypothetical protein
VTDDQDRRQTTVRLPFDELMWIKSEAARQRLWMSDVVELAVRSLRQGLGRGEPWGRTREEGRCPACGADAAYVVDLDRYVHTNGSDNRPCWRKIIETGTESVSV